MELLSRLSGTPAQQDCRTPLGSNVISWSRTWCSHCVGPVAIGSSYLSTDLLSGFAHNNEKHQHLHAVWMNCTRMLFLSPCSSSFPCTDGVCGILSQFFIRLTLPVFVKQLIYLFNYTYFITTCISATVTLSHSTKLG